MWYFFNTLLEVKDKVFTFSTLKNDLLDKLSFTCIYQIENQEVKHQNIILIDVCRYRYKLSIRLAAVIEVLIRVESKKIKQSQLACLFELEKKYISQVVFIE